MFILQILFCIFSAFSALYIKIKTRYLMYVSQRFVYLLNLTRHLDSEEIIIINCKLNRHVRR